MLKHPDRGISCGTPVSRRRLLAAAATVVASPRIARAGPGRVPAGTLRFIVPFAPGGSVDVLGRAVAKAVGEALGRQTLVENVAGGSTNLGSERVAKAAPDGLTILVASDSLAINKSLFPRLSFDPVASFAPVTLAITAPQLLVTHPRSGLNTVADYVAAARARPGELKVGLPGHGVIGHLASELINRRLAGLKVNHIPYNGGAPASRDLIGGHLDALYITLPAVTAQVRDGALRGLATTTAQRSAALPDVPSFAETVVQGLDLASWQGFLVPAGTPADLVAGLDTAIAAALRGPSARPALEGLGFDIVAAGPEVFGKLIRDDVARFAQIVHDAGLAGA
ncbi:Tripartite tricarboxylate transporter family receptor [bacterium YEK0313]|nr:Tripartite tricarboxylate transporter family receptor [bacterium YEK0313]